MSKHILDRRREAVASRAARYLHLERKNGPNRSTEALQKRPRAEKPMAEAPGAYQGNRAKG